MGALPLTTTRRTNRSHQTCQALATVFVAVAPDGKGKLENKLVKAVADAGDGSSGIYEDRRTRRGRCLNCEILSNFFCSAPRSISQGTSRCDPLHRGGAAAKVPARHPFVPSHETPGLRNQAASYGGAMQEVDDVPSSNCATRLSA
jgi:hypothetical protein